ncbi:rhomboid-like protein [Favolaschia claudopus]|uniref:Rhomboid-type serine protease n=1 Tax=Favolaschia claudopus TaxID=2862362 RepID=A0AAW0EIU7_9AGAR
MATPYDHYAYSAAKTHDFDSTHPYTEHDEAFNPASIPERSKAYDMDVSGTHHDLNHHDEEQGFGMHDHEHNGGYNTGQRDTSDTSLVNNAAGVGRSYQDMDYAEPDPYDPTRAKPVAEKASPLVQLLGVREGRTTLEQRIDMKKRGVGRQRYPFLVWILTVAMVATFIYELIENNKAQGTPVSFKPVVNPMLGPSSTTLINVGARFPPCMKFVQDVPPTMQIGCLNNTANPATEICTIEEICGFGGFHGKDPNQWFRFITPIFLHAGFIHLILNMLAQLTVSAQVEREMGTGGFFITYFAAGIFGNVLGANFALVARPSIGASGSIFGCIAVTWVDLFAHWKYHYRPVRKLVFMTIELIIGVAVGYIPYVDNFAHLGGFLMALFVGTIFYPVISVSRRHKIIMTSARILAIPVAVILFVLLTRNFYTSDPYAACEGCRYLSCFPTSSNNHCKGTGLTGTTAV